MGKKLFGKGTLAGLAAAVISFTAFAPTASAAPLVVAGDTVKLYNGPGTTGGGEFWVDVLGKGVGGAINASNNDFLTFCLEKNETFGSYGEPLKVGGVTTGAVNGGVSGGNPDPLAPETAWLYTQFVDGTLSDYSHTNGKADSLQRAIWFLEGELGAGYTLDQLNMLDHQAWLWVGEANDSDWTDVHQVRVLNLLKQDSYGNYTLKSQDQLYITPIPEPETYAMLLAGLGLMGFVARRRRKGAL